MSENAVVLDGLLHSATVALTVSVPGSADPELGTGFLVAPGVVATCAHVVVSKRSHGRFPTAVVGCPALGGGSFALDGVPEWYLRGGGGPDLAFLRAPADLHSGQVLLMNEIAVGDDLWTYGHPAGAFRAGQPATLTYQGPSLLGRQDGSQPPPTGGLEMGRVFGVPVGEGFSGSAVLNRRTGAVAGMLSTSDRAGSAHMVPAAVILAGLEQIGFGQDSAMVNTEWLRALTDDQIRAGGWRFPGPRLRAYLDAVRRATEEPTLPGSPAGTPPLAAVYVPQRAQLMSKAAVLQPVAGEDDRPESRSQPTPVPDPVAAEGVPAALDDGDILLVGGPGAGKSSLLRTVANASARRWLDGMVEHWIPVRILAANLVPSRTLSEAVAAGVGTDLGRVEPIESWPPEFFAREPLRGVRWLVLVDGVDEIIGSAARAEVLAKISALAREGRDSPYRFAVTTRPLPEHELGRWRPTRYELQPFTSEDLTEFARNWFTLTVPDVTAAVHAFLAEIDRTGLRELARIPLMTAMLCRLFTDSPDHRLPPQRAAIHQQFVALSHTRQYAVGIGPGIKEALAQFEPSVLEAAPGAASEPSNGRPLEELADPFELDVHRPIDVGEAEAVGLSALPLYVRRDHDERLAEVLAHAAAGRSAIVVLVGGSSTGKTRACWEALDSLPSGWRLWHPQYPDGPEAFLAGIARLDARTVVWLNDMEQYLPAGDLGRQVAAGMRTVLADPKRAPVVLLGTLWPEHWRSLTASGPSGQVQKLLAGSDVSVPDAFTTRRDLQRLRAAADTDPRLAIALARSEGGECIQYLAGAPALAARYRNAAPDARAVLHAAMDARRMGVGPQVPLPLLVEAAEGYLTEPQYQRLGNDWPERVLQELGHPVHGDIRPLAPVTPRRGQPERPYPCYQLADYLGQLGHRARTEHVPPDAFWDAAMRYAAPTDLAWLADQANDRLLIRHAVRLRTRAVAATADARQAAKLITALHDYARPVHAAARWVADQVDSDCPAAIVDPLDGLLNALRKAGAGEEAAALLARVTAHAHLDDVVAVDHLFQWLNGSARADRFRGLLPSPRAAELVKVLLSREPAAHLDLAEARDSRDLGVCIAHLVGELTWWTEGSADQLVALIARATDRIDPGNPWELHKLLNGVLPILGPAAEQITGLVTALAARAVDAVDLRSPRVVARLLQGLRRLPGTAGSELISALLARDPVAQVSLSLDLSGVSWLIEGLRQVGADAQISALLARDPAARIDLDHADLAGLSGLLKELRKVGADDQALVLAARLMDYNFLTDPGAVSAVLGWLDDANANDLVRSLLARDPAAHVDLDHTDHERVCELLKDLRRLGADDQVTALMARRAARADLADPRSVAALLQPFGQGDARSVADNKAVLDRNPAAHVILVDARAVAGLLWQLSRAKADDQVRTLLARDPARQVDLADAEGVFRLLDAFTSLGADDQVRDLLARDPAAHVNLDDPSGFRSLLRVLRWLNADDQVRTLLARDPAAHLPLENIDDYLIKDLRGAAADDQAETLSVRLANVGRARFVAKDSQWRHGREPGGQPSDPWDWEQLHRATCG